MACSLAASQRTAHQHEDHPRDEHQRNAGGSHHERQAVEHRHLSIGTRLPPLLQDVALHVHHLHPQHVEQQQEQEQEGWRSFRETQISLLCHQMNAAPTHL